MENNYEKFLEKINKLVMKSNRELCYGLIEVAQNYYSLFCQYQNLDRVRHKLANIYDLKNGRAKLKAKQLDIQDRLFLEFYFRLSGVTVNAKNNYVWVSTGKKAELNDIQENYDLKKYDFGKYDLYTRIDFSCQRATKIYSESKQFELRLDNIRKAVNLYKRYEHIKQKTKEESFNNIFSTQYVNWLINIMNADENLLILLIAPLRTVLCKIEQGGKEIDSSTYKHYLKKDFRLTATDLEKRIEEINKCYSSIVHKFIMTDSALRKIEKNLD